MHLAMIQNDFIVALCRTLLHSLWQGLLLALLTGFILVATKKSSARLRYQLLAWLFFGFLFSIAATFAWEWHSLSTHIIFIVQQLPDATAATGTNESSNTIAPSLLKQFTTYFNTHASLIVTIWFVIFLTRLVQLIRSLAYVQRIRNHKTYAPASEWSDKLKTLLFKLSMHQPVRLLESGLVKVPAVMGTLKPVILVPLGMLSQLPPDEIEAILLHELAHIQRRDYFVNLLQSMAETIFFFNPALMWLSAMIREEREHCCDDIALNITDNKTQFINALIAFQEYNLSATNPAMAFPGKKNQLLNRVKRILNNHNKTLNTTEKSILTCAVGIGMIIAFAAASKTPVAPKTHTATKVSAKRDSTHVTIWAASNSYNYVPNGTTTARTASPTQTNTTQHKDTQHKKSISSTTQTVIFSFNTNTQKVNAIDTAPTTKTPPSPPPPSPVKCVNITGTVTIQNSPTKNGPLIFQNTSTNASLDGTTKTVGIAATTKDGHKYTLIRVNDRIIGFTIDGIILRDDQFKEHQDEINQVNALYKEAGLTKINVGMGTLYTPQTQLAVKNTTPHIDSLIAKRNNDLKLKKTQLLMKIQYDVQQKNIEIEACLDSAKQKVLQQQQNSKIILQKQHQEIQMRQPQRSNKQKPTYEVPSTIICPTNTSSIVKGKGQIVIITKT